MMLPLDAQTILCIRIAVALLFAAAAIGKLRSPAAFRATLAGYRLLPPFAIPMGAAILPIAEMLVAAGLLVEVLHPWPEYCAAGLLVLFACAMGVNLLRGYRAISCGCSFGGGKQLDWSAVIRNLGLALLVCLAAAPAAQPFSIGIALVSGISLFAIFGAIDAVWAPLARHPVAPVTRRVL